MGKIQANYFSMEGMPKFEAANQAPDAEKSLVHVENIEAWRSLRDEAPQAATERISKIKDFEKLDAESKLQELAELIDRLAKEGNHTRFIAKEIAREKEVLKEEMSIERARERIEMLKVA